MTGGYAGADSGQLAIVDEIGNRVTHGEAASVGYQLLVLDYQTLFARTHDPHHRAGAWFDYLFLSRWNVQNTNHSIAGLAEGDRYRIVELPSPCTADQVPRNSPWPGYRQVRQFSCYVLYQTQ